jgi:tetratricopeptide (TPR) repeat protein
MKFSKILFVGALLSFVFFLSLSVVAAKDEWVKVRSKNFQLVGNSPEKDIRAAAVRLEQFRETFRQIFPKIDPNSPVPINVIVFKNDKSFRDFKPVGDDGKRSDWVAGYFQSGEAVNYIVLSSDGEKDFTYRIIFHEYTHFLVNNHIGRSNVPPWFNEGLAEYYEMFKIENDQRVTLGGLNNEHLLLLQQNKLIPFETFFNVDNYSLQRQGHNSAGLFYAQAWALMHYLMQSSEGARAPQLNKFTSLVLNGKTPKEAFTEAFQTDYATMERELKKYVEQKSFRVSLFTFKNKVTFDAEMQSAPVSESEAKAVLGDLLYHSNRLNEAAVMLSEALKLDAGSSLANTSLGLVRMRQNNFEEAEKQMEKAVRLDEKNYLAHYYYAYILSRKGMTEFGFVSSYNLEQAEKMRESLKKSIALNPNFPESYNLYAFVSAVRNEAIDESITFLGKAINLAPGNQWYQIRLAELYMRKENFASARLIAQKVFDTAPDDALRVYAKNAVNLINTYEAQLENIKNYNRRLRQSDVTNQPLTEEEAARLNYLAMLEGINQTLRKLKADEKRSLGYLTSVVCGANGIEYSVKIDNQVLKLTSENFDSILLMSFDGNLSNDEFGCGTIKKEMFAVVTYRPSANAKGKSAGEIVAIEFVPKNFKLSNQ